MIDLKETMIMPVNIFACVMLAGFMISGYKKGGIRSVLSLVGTALSFYVAWLLSDPLAKHVLIYKPDVTDLASALINEAGSYLINRMIWFVITFVILRIVLFVLDKVLEGIHRIPGFHLIGGILGAVLGAIETLVWILVICVLLETPLFTNGSMIINESVLGIVRDRSSELLGDFSNMNEGADLFSSLKDNMDQISQDQVDAFETWLIENDFQIGESE